MIRLIASLLVALTLSAVPASAHTEHRNQQQAAQAQAQQGRTGVQGSAAIRSAPTAAHGQMGEMMGDERDPRASMSTTERLLDWLGRWHPIIVHFPIGFFPAALFTAILGRRRPAFAAPVQFLVVAGAILAPIAAILGWLDAMTADASKLLTVHRWLGTAIGIVAIPLGFWALRRPDQDRSTGMIAALSLVTAAIVVQAWYGGALVHGIDHLNW